VSLNVRNRHVEYNTNKKQNGIGSLKLKQIQSKEERLIVFSENPIFIIITLG
jgi:hypothetical protein